MSYQGFSETYRSARTRSRVVVAFLGITGIVLLLSAFHYFSGFDLIRDAEAGSLTDSEATLFDQATQVYASLYVLAFIATAIAYLAWLSRTVDNVPKLTKKLPEVTPRWSIGWWFVPIANFLKPYQIVRDVNSLLATEITSAGNGIVFGWSRAWVASSSRDCPSPRASKTSTPGSQPISCSIWRLWWRQPWPSSSSGKSSPGPMRALRVWSQRPCLRARRMRTLTICLHVHVAVRHGRPAFRSAKRAASIYGRHTIRPKVVESSEPPPRPLRVGRMRGTPPA